MRRTILMDYHCDLTLDPGRSGYARLAYVWLIIDLGNRDLESPRLAGPKSKECSRGSRIQ
ncbi:Uncharacterised protein [uncultured archaeon]|nr:Uncharacterised protein [uncultured archaeon]